MPIRADLRLLYPANWKAISLRRREAAAWRCEWCQARQGEPNPFTGSIVVLTVAHLDRDPSNNPEDGSNHAALCQRCHLNHDREQHMRNAAVTRRRAMATLELELEG